MKTKLRLMKSGICVLNYSTIKLLSVTFTLTLIDVIFCRIYVNNIFYSVNSIIITYQTYCQNSSLLKILYRYFSYMNVG